MKAFFVIILSKKSVLRMSRLYDDNPYENVTHGARWRGSPKLTRLRELRLRVRASNSQEDLQTYVSILNGAIKQEDIYRLKMQGVPYGLDCKSMQDCFLLGKEEKQQLALRVFVSDALIQDIGRAIYLGDQEALHKLYAQAEQVSETAWNLQPHLRNEAIKIQALIALGYFDEAEAIIDHMLALYPQDDFCLYCKAEVLIERPVKIWGLFGHCKSDDLREAQLILHALMPSAAVTEDEGVPMYQSKHDLVWAKWRKLEARCAAAGSSQQQDAYAKAMLMAKKVDSGSIFYRQAQQLIVNCQSLVQDGEDSVCWSPF